MNNRALTLDIRGMSCGHCLKAVNQALGSLTGVTVDSVRIGRADLHFDPSQVTPERITSAVEEAGYDATVVASAHG
jgi:copper chaperone